MLEHDELFDELGWVPHQDPADDEQYEEEKHDEFHPDVKPENLDMYAKFQQLYLDSTSDTRLRKSMQEQFKAEVMATSNDASDEENTDPQVPQTGVPKSMEDIFRVS